MIGIAASRRVARDHRGATIVEFALILPVMLSLIMGFMELAYGFYVRSVFVGAVQKAGRDSGIENNDTQTAQIDQKVIALVQQVAPRATFQPSQRTNYSSFNDVNGEQFDDTNKNGKWDPGECFYDVNGNKSYDSSLGATGQGGANDVVLYSMTMSYPRLFPLGWIGWSNTQQITASTILQNQPYAASDDETAVKIC